MEQFNYKIEQILTLWELQKNYAIEADELLQQCEELESQMFDLLKEAQELNPGEYDKFLQTFNVKEENDEHLDNF
jgi:hypothetical protein